MTLSHTSFCVVSPKEKEKKRNINNDLAVLPSHDTSHLHSDSDVLSPGYLVCPIEFLIVWEDRQ